MDYYDVFLSFRGVDTGKTFTDHLYAAFATAGIRAFREDDVVERGEDITPKLQKAIQQSQCSVIVLSKDYASSKWCLDQLVRILEHRRTSDTHVVLPVFYDIDPSDVRIQRGRFATAFARHEETQPLTKIMEWRAALTEVGNLAGMALQNEADGYESKCINKIVQVIGDRLSHVPLSVAPRLIGIHSRVRNINSWLRDGATDIGILIIYGMRGIGKTTIAKHVYNSNFQRFEGRSFLENIREISEQPNGLVRIQQQLLSDVLGGRKVIIHSVSEGINKIGNAISSKKVLLVLDDLDHMYQFEAIARMKDSFYPGSKIIITTTNARLLPAHEMVYKMHSVEPLDYTESMELFSWHAFGHGHPIEGYMEHSKRIVHHCGGLPLALNILGSSLTGRSIYVWENALRKLEAIPHSSIMKELKVSYDSLQDDHDKGLFLHIACFFIGKDKDYIVRVLDGCDFFTTVGIEILIDRCLVTIDTYNKVQMHDMIRDMGRAIVRQESEELGKRSRLWHHKDSFKVLTENMGTERIEGLVLNQNMHSIDAASRNSNEIVLETNAFSRMHNLKLLQLSHVRFNGSYEEFPTELRWLSWLKFPLVSIPSDLPLENLVVLEMQYSNLKRVLRGTKHLPSLKILDVSHSHCLKVVADFSLVPNLETLILKDCVSLVDVESIEMLERLVFLNMEDCKNIRKLPEKIGRLEFLETFLLSGCSNLKEFPMSMIKMKSLKVFLADEIPFNQLLHASLHFNSWLTFAHHTSFNMPLKLKVCVNVAGLPEGMKELIKLRYLDVTECQKKLFIDYQKKLLPPKDSGKQTPKPISSKTGKAGNGVHVVDHEYGKARDPSLMEFVMYCSLFPSDFEFRKDELVQLWIAEGFITESQRVRMEDTGIAYFNDLENKRFFLPSRFDFRVDFDSVFSVPINDASNFLYKVNPTQLSIYENTSCGSNYFRAVDGKVDGASEMTQHLSLIGEEFDQMSFGVLQKFKRLRSLLFLSGCGASIKHVPRNLLSSLRFLRTLNLSQTLISELPSTIQNVKTLRYLDVSSTPITRLPEAIDSLHNLQTIKLRRCIHFVQLPKGMEKLTSLRHIELDIIQQLDSMPARMGKLTNLQTLSAFLVGRDDGRRIGELKNLNHLKGALRISRLENVFSEEEAREAALMGKDCLQKLELQWTDNTEEEEAESICPAEKEEKILHWLQPHFGIRELRILCFGGSKLPTWISNRSFTKLVVLTLYKCNNCELLPSMGELPALKFLSLIEMNEVKTIDHQFFRNSLEEHQALHAFPKLEVLQINSMLNLREWRELQIVDLPSLHNLTVDSCPELVTLPSFSCLKSLKHLELRNCPKLLPLPELPTSLESLTVVDCPELREWCNALDHVPTVWFDHEVVSKKEKFSNIEFF